MCPGRGGGAAGSAVRNTRRLVQALSEMLMVPETKSRTVQQVGSCLRFLVGDDTSVVVDLRGGNSCGGRGADPVREGDTRTEVDATVRLSDADFGLICSGKLSPGRAFMTGRLAVTGNLVRAMRCEPLFLLLRTPLRPPPPSPPTGRTAMTAAAATARAAAGVLQAAAAAAATPRARL